MIYLTIIVITLCLFALGACIWEAHKAARRHRDVFKTYPQTPTNKDKSALSRLSQESRRDRDIEREWRERVAVNVAKREARQKPCMFHVKQAE